MSKKKCKIEEPERASSVGFGSGQTGAQNAVPGGLTSSGRYEHVLFIDTNSEISQESVESLEEAGFIVVPVVGEPSRAIYQATIYKS
jgi:hypothetical protein